MKILHVVPLFGTGGMEKVICSIINGVSMSYDHEVLTLYNNIEAKKWIKNNEASVRCLNRGGNQLQFLQMLHKSIREINPDVLMTYAWGATDAIWLGRHVGIRKIIHNEHGFNVDEAAATYFKRDAIRFFVYRMASRIIVVSKELKKIMNNRFLLEEENVIFIANGIDTKTYSSDPYERISMRRVLGYAENDFVVGFCGRLDPVKNFDFMLDIFKECTDKDKNFKLLIIGDGPEKKNIEAGCHNRHIEKNVQLVGRQENVLPYLRTLDVFLLTSLREQMPMAILEAMALALPVVSTDVGEVADLIQHGKQGMVWDVHERPETFAASLLILRDQQMRHSMGASSRQKVLTAFTEEVMVQKYQKVIDSLALS
jgi:glycosyltransferase involved in cell wall biosynthesis